MAELGRTVLAPSNTRSVERASTYTALGLRLEDAALGVPVTDDLEVTLWRPGTAGAGIPAVITPSGTFSFHGIPGLRAVERPPLAADPAPGDPDGIADLPQLDEAGTKVRAVVSVVDRRNRFLPALIPVQLPLDSRGVFGGNGGLLIFSSPGRRVPPEMAAVRVDLWDRTNGRPTANAVVRVSIGNETIARGISDERGRALVLFPYSRLPAPAAAPGNGAGAAAGAGGAVAEPPPIAREWDLTIRVEHQPAVLNEARALARTPGAPDRLRRLPTLDAVGSRQDASRIIESAAVPAGANSPATAEQITATLLRGQELRLTTAPAAGAGPNSTLWIAGTPPD